MTIIGIDVTAMEINGLENLDQVVVYWEDLRPSQGRVTITCYGEAWTAFWNAMDGRKVQQFFLRCDDNYIAHRLIGAQFQKHTQGHLTYLKRIIRAIKEELRNTYREQI